MIWNIAGDDGAGTDEGVAADGYATDDRRIGTQGRTLSHKGAAVGPLSRNGGARDDNIGEDEAWAAENLILQGNPIVKRDIVLGLDPRSDTHIIADEDVLSHHAILANDRPAAEVPKIPDPQ